MEDTEKNLATKKQRLDELEQHVKDNLERLRDFEELGMTAEQVKGIMTEKDNLKSEVGKQEAVMQERDMLKEKLLNTKEELYQAEKKSRSKIELLEEVGCVSFSGIKLLQWIFYIFVYQLFARRRLSV